MITLLAWLVTLVVFVLALPAIWFAVEVALAWSPRRETKSPRADVRYVVIVPAHDEEAGLGATLDSLAAALDERGSVLVIADNCTDATAEVARRHGVEVVERTDPDHRGKGFALGYAAQTLRPNPPDLLVFVDADCLVDREALGRLVDEAAASGGPVQADYLLVGDDPSPKAALSTLAFLVRNRVRPLGLARLGGPCGLFGTGMAMPYSLFVSLPSAEGHLVEDMWLGIECALRGHAPTFVPDAYVTSAAASREATVSQRTRWEHGHLSVLRDDVPRLFASGKIQAILLGMDLAIPPLALLVAIELCALGLSIVAGIVLGAWSAVAVSTSALIWVGLAVYAAWWKFARDRVPGRALLAVPGYVLSKLSIYRRFIGRPATSWVRTDRSSREP